MLFNIEDSNSGTVIQGENREEILRKYLELLKTQNEDINNHEGYAPGYYASGFILGRGYGAREKWVNKLAQPSEPSYTSVEMNVREYGPQPKEYYNYGKCSRKNIGWTNFVKLHFEPSYTLEKFEQLIHDERIRVREMTKGVVMYSYLPG